MPEKTSPSVVLTRPISIPAQACMPTVSSISTTTTAMVPTRPAVIGCRPLDDGPLTVTGTAAAFRLRRPESSLANGEQPPRHERQVQRHQRCQEAG